MRPALPVAVVGAGMSGIAMALELDAAGVGPVTLFERAEGLGGTWRDNVYPGCACDIPSHLYSLKRAPNPGWTRRFSGQPEILEYLQQAAGRARVTERIRFGAAVEAARFDEEAGMWRLELAGGECFEARALVLAIGGLVTPRWPDIPGREAFQGEMMHSARWRSEVSIDGRRVAVVGTGASAAQIIPELAGRASQLTVYQRTPAWVVPRADRAVPGWLRRLYAAWPALQAARRLSLYLAHEMRAWFFVRRPGALPLVEALARRHLDAQVSDPALRARLRPSTRMGCKRVVVSDDLYPALTRDDVELVDAAVAEVRPEGLIAGGVLREHELVIFATGFDVLDGLWTFPAYGRGGRSLAQAWPEGPEAYYGVATTGFPNLFFLLGPNTALGHNSVLLMIEAQARAIAGALRRMADRRLRELEVRAEAQARFQVWLQRRLQGTVWLSGCRSWYLDEAGRNRTIWPGFVFEYERAMRRLRYADFLAG